ncbi:uracil-DNA glycosylase [Fructobacillus americanaquae]|uniref:Uracil-DNA glycosylase n=1 Tax=Fructobacillus americanaquae TaxID=2940302 RepID=A0ABY5C476_9LACO|nr:uracil-DNA glycosylase [Fructobacillus americanaquae]USS92358.1 uracil-DNA glycosylase [Fructobacillus americanaquae]
MADFSLTKTDWDQALAPLLPIVYQHRAESFLSEIYQNPQKPVYPQRENVFLAFEKTPLAQTKVVILGQDPYHGESQAQGLAFSVPDTLAAPPSLRNILKELASDVGFNRSSHDLTTWASQGVLLLNTVLTVAAGQANSHQKKGWEELSDAAIKAASADQRPKVFILWGKPAQQKARLIDAEKHLILMAPHPSPLAAYRGFFGSKPFSKTNAFLERHQEVPVNWLK